VLSGNLTNKPFSFNNPDLLKKDLGFVAFGADAHRKSLTVRGRGVTESVDPRE
jgi:hypothetical protein